MDRNVKIAVESDDLIQKAFFYGSGIAFHGDGSGEGVIGAKGSANIGRAYAGSSASKYSATSGGKK